MRLLLVCVGGALGSGGRYLLATWATRPDFPSGTLLVNVLGSFAIGAIMQTAPREDLRVLLVVGVLGGFTTFSAFSYETVALFQRGNAGVALLNVAASLIGCLGATALGMAAVGLIKA